MAERSNNSTPSLVRQVAQLPKDPGVYLMREGGGEILYIGKAKDLRNRVKSYLGTGDGRAQIQYLMKRVIKIDSIVTQSEEQACVLERDLINKYKPRFNIRLKDDKAYLSIRIDLNADWPRIELVRKVHDDGARYFGPYAWSYELRSLLEAIKRIVPLRTCADTVFFNRQRPCLEYQIKRCAGPCCLPVDREVYKSWVTTAINVLEGKHAVVLKQLNQQMDQASEALKFEEAAAWRDRIQIVEHFQAGHSLISDPADNRDVFGIYREDTQVSVCVLFVRGGRIVDSRMFSFADVRISDDEILEASVEQFYNSGAEIPPEIIVPFEFENMSMVARSIELRRGAKLELGAAKRGTKARLLAMARLNARQYYIGTLAADNNWSELSTKLAKLLGLSQLPRRIECADISNFQGSDIVGAIVSFFDGLPDRSLYRKYNLSFQGKPDDFRAIHEIVERRLKRGLEEGDLPDLLIIDGGPGQLSMALKARDDLKLTLDIVSIAKMKTESDVGSSELKTKPERIYIENRDTPIDLTTADPVTHFFQRIRDEVHRFVITFHRKKRGKRAVKSILDDIPGVGPERRRRLLTHYGSIQAIGVASVDDLARAGRMPRPLAQKIQRIIRGVPKG